MIDKFGKEVFVGDKIITWLETGYGSGTSLQICTINKVTERLVFFEYVKQRNKRYSWQEKESVVTGKRTSEQFILYNGEKI